MGDRNIPYLKIMLSLLPQFKNRQGFFYIEYASVFQKNGTVCFQKDSKEYIVPSSTLSTIVLGPGTSITHSAVKLLSENKCVLLFMSRGETKLYSVGLPSSGSITNLEVQVNAYTDNEKRLRVARKMFEIRFEGAIPENYTIEQMRGLEGNYTMNTYNHYSAKFGVVWRGRIIKSDWDSLDNINKCLSLANSYLYAVCTSAIISLGFSTALGFVHHGKNLSFVYDVADLYKERLIIPVCFNFIKDKQDNCMTKDDEDLLKTECQKMFQVFKLQKNLVTDIYRIFE